MNKNINNIFICIQNNKVIAIDTNLKTMHDEFVKIVPELSYQQLYRAFQRSNNFTKTLKNGETYWFEVIENKNQ